MNLLPKHDILRRLAELIELKHRNVSGWPATCCPPRPVCRRQMLKLCWLADGPRVHAVRQKPGRLDRP